jgi:hypothetical protein
MNLIVPSVLRMNNTVLPSILDSELRVTRQFCLTVALFIFLTLSRTLLLADACKEEYLLHAMVVDHHTTVPACLSDDICFSSVAAS